MRLLVPALFCFLTPLLASTFGAESQSDAPGALSLWYDKPAEFTIRPSDVGGRYKTLIDEGMLIGNGRFGAMIQGGVDRELLRVSENTVWSGGVNPDGDYGKNFGRFEALGDLSINLSGQQPSSDYRRGLDLKDAIATVTYEANGITYKREYFSSQPDQVLVVRLTASKPGSYSGALEYTDSHQRVSTIKGNLITTVGGLPNYLAYETQILVLNDGGSQKVTGRESDQKIEFDHCDSLTIVMAAGTNYLMDASKRFLNLTEKPHKKVSKQLEAAAAQPFEQLKATHVANYQSLFNRFSIDLGTSSEAQRTLPTNLRCKQAFKEIDPEFDQLMCQYGRYLVISTSRPGGVAANGQGIWNDCNLNQFGARYTNDLAPTPMDYWSVETTNLAGCHLPLLDLIQSQLPVWRSDTRIADELKTTSGELTKRGWETRANHNIMGGQCMWWNKGGNAWYLNHFWEHFAFGNDKEYLRKVVYPLLKETCEYWEDHLKARPDGRLIVTNLKYSPEHGPFDVDGASYSQELVYDLFTNYLDACDILGVDKEYRAKVADMREKLLKPGIGSWGQLLEWMTEMKDFPPASEREKMENAREGHIDTPQNGHICSSHLLGVYPFRQISYEQTPELAAAAKVSTIARGNGHGSIGISFIQRAAIFARLYDGELAYGQLRKFYPEAKNNLLSLSGFDATPAFPGALAELLLQSHQKDIHVLPALPKAWPTGSAKGLRARGGYEVDEQWKEGKLTSLTIRSVTGNSVNVRYGDKTVKAGLHPGASVVFDGNLQPKK